MFGTTRAASVVRAFVTVGHVGLYMEMIFVNLSTLNTTRYDSLVCGVPTFLVEGRGEARPFD